MFPICSYYQDFLENRDRKSWEMYSIFITFYSKCRLLHSNGYFNTLCTGEAFFCTCVRMYDVLWRACGIHTEDNFGESLSASTLLRQGLSRCSSPAEIAGSGAVLLNLWVVVTQSAPASSFPASVARGTFPGGFLIPSPEGCGSFKNKRVLSVAERFCEPEGLVGAAWVGGWVPPPLMQCRKRQVETHT